jgi:UDP-glucuronate 4-epimerase
VKILVTGGAGFIGSSLCEVLLARGDEVIAIDNFNDYYSPARKRANVAPMQPNPRFTLYEADFREAETVRQIVEHHRPEAIAHLGAMGSVRYSVKEPVLYVETNITGTVNMLAAAQAASVPHFVFASTSSVYGQTDQVPFVETQSTDFPLAPYPATKKSAETLGHAYHNMHGLSFTALRFFNVYGPKGRPDMMPYIVLERLRQQQEITLFDNGQMHRDWTYIDDILNGVVAAIDRPLG